MWIDGVTADQVPIFNQERASGNNIYQVEQTFSQPQPSTAAPTTMMQNGILYGSQYQPNQIPATQPLGRPQARMRINCSCGAPGNVRCISSSCKACCQRAAVAWGGNSCQAQDHQKNNRIALQQKGWVPPPSSQPSSSHYPNLSLPNQLRYPPSFPSQQPSSTLATTGPPTITGPATEPFILDADTSPALQARFLEPTLVAPSRRKPFQSSRKFTFVLLNEDENLIMPVDFLLDRPNAFKLNDYPRVIERVEGKDIRRWNQNTNRWEVLWADDEYTIKESEEIIIRPASMDLNTATDLKDRHIGNNTTLPIKTQRRSGHTVTAPLPSLPQARRVNLGFPPTPSVSSKQSRPVSWPLNQSFIELQKGFRKAYKSQLTGDGLDGKFEKVFGGAAKRTTYRKYYKIWRDASKELKGCWSDLPGAMFVDFVQAAEEEAKERREEERRKQQEEEWDIASAKAAKALAAIRDSVSDDEDDIDPERVLKGQSSTRQDQATIISSDDASSDSVEIVKDISPSLYHANKKRRVSLSGASTVSSFSLPDRLSRSSRSSSVATNLRDDMDEEVDDRVAHDGNTNEADAEKFDELESDGDDAKIVLETD